ncbi:MAG: GTPase Era [Treponema sp.]|jgi:GTP-binding protein Era|nr:GTPase Era [Treponema sp.]
MEQKKAAFAAVVGRPSAGKSTLVNLLCGSRVAIVSPVPQTTRNAIRGIVNRDRGQLVLVDTPGMHLSGKKFNRRLSETAVRSAGEADIVLYVLDASRAPGSEEEAVAAQLARRNIPNPSDGTVPAFPVLAAINKMDLPAADYGRTREFLRRAVPALDDSRCFPVSAEKNEGVETLLSKLYDLAPEGTPFYPEEYYTDQEVDFRIAEIIRGAALPHLRQELPHSIYVEVADREFRGGPEPGGPGRGGQKLWVRAFIICERESQKGMIVGRGGTIVKAIGEASRRELNRIFDWKVELDLRVKTGKDWRHNDALLRKLLDR